MSLDTKYRPIDYADVLGQETTIEILQNYVSSGHGFRQSYIFAGPFGSGKTTLARILARALLCDNPKEGNPCNQCPSCQSILDPRKDSESFIEVDAATNSGKDDVAKLIEDISTVGTFSGKRKIYLWDECFTEDTMLLTPEGPRSIKDLVETKYNGEVLSYSIETLEPCWRPVSDWFDIPDERECLELEFEDGTTLTVTTDQEIFTRNRGWVAASELSMNDDICEVSLAKFQPCDTPK